jgi:hypothetical protein
MAEAVGTIKARLMVKDEDVNSFREITGSTQDEAIRYLEV